MTDHPETARAVVLHGRAIVEYDDAYDCAQFESIGEAEAYANLRRQPSTREASDTLRSAGPLNPSGTRLPPKALAQAHPPQEVRAVVSVTVPTKLKLRFALWVSGWAGTLCAWAAGVEQAFYDDLPKCPDCGLEPWDGDYDSECWTCNSIQSQQAEEWMAHHEVER